MDEKQRTEEILAKCVCTPHGDTPKGLLPQIVKYCGIRWSKEYKAFIITSDPCEYLRINKNEHRRANEDHLIKMKGYLPVSYYNFKYALHQHKKKDARKMTYGEIYAWFKESLNYLKASLTDVDGTPSMLPDRIEMKTGQRKSYTKIMKEIDDAEHNF